MEQPDALDYKLQELIKKTGYHIYQQNGQRKFGPPPDWVGAPPPKGSEVFIGKLPRDIFEDELVPVFSSVGKIYEMRLMMDFSGSNRGYAFVTYSTPLEAYAAIKQLDGYEIRPHRHIGVVKSVDNCKLFIGCIPKNKTKEEVHEELAKRVSGIVKVIMYKNCYDRRQNRGFAFVEFTSHRAAAMARRALVPGCVKIWDKDLTIDWAEPEPHVNELEMKKVKVLYVRNFHIKTTPEVIQTTFESAIDCKLERVKKFNDYAFIHFYDRQHAELALTKLQNAEIDGSHIEINWAIPVNREIYKIQKKNRGNAKFNTNLNLLQTLLLYKQHVEKREYNYSPKEDEGIGSGYTGNSICGSPPYASSSTNISPLKEDNQLMLAPTKLDAICKRHLWASPIYEYHKCVDYNGREMYICSVELPYVSMPLVAASQRLGPIQTRLCLTIHQAHNEAAECMLNHIKMMGGDYMQQVPTIPTTLAPLYPTIVSPALHSVPPVRYPYEYLNNSIYSRPHALPIPRLTPQTF